MKKIAVFSLVIACLGLLSISALAAKSKQIGVVFSALGNPVFVFMREKMEAKIKELGYEPIILDSREKSEEEFEHVESLIAKGVAGICILPVNDVAVFNAVKMANTAGIPIVGWNRYADPKGKGEFVTQVVTDNRTGAVEAGKYAVALLKEVADPKIVLLRGTAGIDADVDRSEGFKTGIKGTALEKAIVAEERADFERVKGYNVMEKIIQKTPQIDLVYAMNDEMALGAYQALKAVGLTNVKIIGFDGAQGYVQEIVNGNVTATVAQQFALLGTSAVEYAVKAAEGTLGQVDKVIYVGTELITPENAKGYVFK